MQKNILEHVLYIVARGVYRQFPEYCNRQDLDMVVKNHIWSGIYLEYVETGRECESEFLVGFDLFPN